jgi:RNA polymerase sigma factor (sigma-70 family)
MEDVDLLKAYVQNRSDSAFDELMRRHVDLVYTAARRCVVDAHLAEDVTQAVFIVLSRKAAALKHDVILPAWLLHVTRLTASNALRQRKNQVRIERKAASMSPERTAPPPSDEMGDATCATGAARLAPLLDDAIAGLAESDRNALVLRYFSRFTLAEVGKRLGVSEAAADKRVSRAAERLRKSLIRGGAVLSLLALEHALTGSGVAAAPAEVAEKLTSAIAADAAGIHITPGVELANHTMQALRVPAYKSLWSGTAAIVAASFMGGVLLTYFVLSHKAPAPSASAQPVANETPPQERSESVLAPPLETPPVDDARIPNAARLPRVDGQRTPFTPPDELVPAQGTHVNLMARVNLSADNLNGDWSQTEQTLQSGMKAYSLVQLPYIPPDEYDYHATFTVLQTRGEVVMLCARKGADFGWQMGARENRTTIFDISPRYDRNNPSRRDTEAVFTAGVPYDVTVQVRNNGMAAYIDQKLIGKLETNYRGLGAFEYWQLQNRAALGVGTWGTPTRFDSLEVIEVSGPGKWLREEGQPVVPLARPALSDPAQWAKAVDLMPLIDPERDAVSGKWERNAEGELVSGQESLARLEIPYKPPEEYDFKMVFTRNSGWDTIAQCFGHGQNNLIWGMAMWGNELNMFRCVTAFEGTNPTTVWAKEFIQNGKRYESIVQVRKQGYAAFIDGTLISSWDRGYGGAHVSKEWRLPTPGALGIASSKNRMTFHSLQLLEISGKGSTVTSKDSKRLEPLPAEPRTESPQDPRASKPIPPPQDAF